MAEEKEMSEAEKVENAASVLEEMTNVYGCQHNLNELAFKMTRMHRTLVQSFASAFVIHFVRELAKLYREDRFDDRNRMACEACAAMAEALEKKYDITPEDRLSLPLI